MVNVCLGAFFIANSASANNSSTSSGYSEARFVVSDGSFERSYNATVENSSSLFQYLSKSVERSSEDKKILDLLGLGLIPVC